MRRLLPRITRRPAERDTTAASPPAEQPTAASPPAEQPTVVAPPAEPAPAGTEPAAPQRPGFRERSRLRRRLQYLRRVRELGFRDLGGLVFDQHRFARPDESLLQAKLTALAAVDGELRAIERALRDERPLIELREVGVSACARCGALVGSDARYCSSCGTAVRGPRDVAPLVADPTNIAPPPAPAPATGAEPQVTGEHAGGGEQPPAAEPQPAGQQPAAGEQPPREAAPAERQPAERLATAPPTAATSHSPSPPERR